MMVKETPEMVSKDQEEALCGVFTGIGEVEKELGMDDDKLMELVDHHQKEAIRDVDLGIGFTTAAR